MADKDLEKELHQMVDSGLIGVEKDEFNFLLVIAILLGVLAINLIILKTRGML